MTAALVPELYCLDIERTRAFYCDTLGFEVVFARPEDNFLYLRLGKAELMIEQPGDPGRTWLIPANVPLDGAPRGRGINIQIVVPSVEPLRDRLEAAGIPLFLDVEERWYRRGDEEIGQRQFVVADPDSYLLRFGASLGIRRRLVSS